MSELDHLQKKPSVMMGAFFLTPKTGDSKRRGKSVGLHFILALKNINRQCNSEMVYQSSQEKCGVWQRKVMKGKKFDNVPEADDENISTKSKYACKSKLCVKIFIVKQRPKMRTGNTLASSSQ